MIPASLLGLGKVRHFGCDHTRRNRVDANAARAKHEPEVLATRMSIAANLRNDGLGLGRSAAIVHQDLGTPLRQGQRSGAADAAGRTSNECCFSGQISRDWNPPATHLAEAGAC